MRNTDAAKTGWYIGVGAGVVLFVLLGLLAGPLLGSAVGLKIIEILYGTMGTEALPRIILGVSMVLGLLVSAAVYILGSGLIGWTVGYIAGAARSRVYVFRRTPASNESARSGLAGESMPTGSVG